MKKEFQRSALYMFFVGVAVFGALWAHELLSRTTPAQKLATLRDQAVAAGGDLLETTLAGKPIALLLEGCRVFSVDASGSSVKKTQVLRPGFYFGLDICSRQNISVEGAFVKVFISTQAFGAGGGNITGGEYRSRDGLAWEKNTDKGWRPVAEAQ